MTDRIKKVNSLLEHEISQLIQRQVALPNNVLATLTHVDATSNLIEANVYISVLPEEKSKQVIEILNDNVREIQQEINKKLNMRPIPRIKFVADKMEAEAGRVEELLARLKNEEK